MTKITKITKVTKREMGCNTRRKTHQIKAQPARNWCFTLNNWTDQEVTDLQSNDYKYCFQKEVGESGTPHLQGFIVFVSKKRFAQVKELFPKANLSKMKKTLAANIIYCTKKETSTGEVYTNMKQVEKKLQREKPNYQITKEFNEKIKTCLREIDIELGIEMHEAIKNLPEFKHKTIEELRDSDLRQHDLRVTKWE